MYNLEVGDHAIAEQIVPCGMCRMCNKGSYHMCKCQFVSACCHYTNSMYTFLTVKNFRFKRFHYCMLSFAGVPHDVYGFKQKTQGALYMLILCPQPKHSNRTYNNSVVKLHQHCHSYILVIYYMLLGAMATYMKYIAGSIVHNVSD